jgi:transposase
MEASMGRVDILDEHWLIVEPFLPSERGRGCRPAHDNRRFFNGMMFALRTGVPWRDLPSEYGNWNSVFRRFRRWCDQGIFDALLDSLVELGMTDDWQDQMVDSTSIRGHSQAAGAKGGPSRRDLAARAAALRAKFTLVATGSGG